MVKSNQIKNKEGKCDPQVMATTTHCYHDIFVFIYDSGGHLMDTTKSYQSNCGEAKNEKRKSTNFFLIAPFALGAAFQYMD